MEHLVKAGLWRIRVSIESGSERTKREIYQRPISNDAVLKASRVLRDYPNVVPCYFFIIGNPYEEQRDLIDTIRFMAKLARPYYSQMFNLVFFPGADIYDRAVSDGIITGVQDSGYELHFRGGFKYEAHAWKQKNLYLNGLLFLAEGKATWFRLGLLPRFLIPLLTHPSLVRLVDQRRIISQVLITGKFYALSLREKVGSILKRLIRQPAGVYNLPLFLKDSAKGTLSKSFTALQKWLPW